LLRVINEPSRGIGDKSLSDLIFMARNELKPLWDIMQTVSDREVYKPAKTRISEFVALINEVKADLGTHPLVDTVRDLMDKTGYVQQYVIEGTHESLARRENILELINAISQFENDNPGSDLAAFLQDVSLVTDADALEEGKPAVTIMTSHAAKGLEFNVVYVVGMEEELFPIGARNGEEANLEEERRLFYVAITRAKKELFLSHSRSRYRYGEHKDSIRSRFINEIDPTVLRTETGASVRRMGTSSGYGYLSSSPAERTKNLSSGVKVVYDDSWSKPQTQSSSTHTQIDYDAFDGDPFQAGQRVMHPTFGQGKILVRDGVGEEAKVTVFFNSYGQKKLLLKFAKLKPLA